MKILITGATGYIGHKLALKAVDEGYTVHVLARNKHSRSLPVDPKIIPFEGDILDSNSILRAMKGCRHVIHCAAVVQYHQKEHAVFYEVNVKGTRNMLSAALQLNVQRFVFTSSCAVIGPSWKHPMRESDYDLSKYLAEKLVKEYTRKGLHAVIVAPARVYGPGPSANGNVFASFISGILSAGIGVIPSDGTSLANYVYIDDVVNGHFLALKKDKAGQKYILGGENISYNTFFSTLDALAPRNIRLVRIPKPLLLFWSALNVLICRLVGKHINVSPRTINRLLRNRTVSSEKAIKQPGYSVTHLVDGLRQTLHNQNSH